MGHIPPKERFSQHAASVQTPRALLNEAAGAFGLSPETVRLTRLSGGFMNANYLAEAPFGLRVVLRVYAEGRRTAEREFAVLRHLERFPVAAPRALAILEAGGRAVTVLSYLDGETLEDRLIREPDLASGLYERLGRELGEIHAITFPEAGFLGPDLQVGREYERFAPFLRAYIERTVQALGDERLDAETRRRLLRLVAEQWPLVDATEPRLQLVHTDFNPKNIMVSRDAAATVLGILDWEFCLVGNGLIDLGNFLRFAGDYPPDAAARLAAGYRSAQPLPEDWQAVARLLDLGNMASFLERREDYQRTFRTARAVIAGTLAHFGY